MQAVTKVKNGSYSDFLHEPLVGQDGKHYCRAMHSCLDDGFLYCNSCPLCERASDLDDISCRYFDIADGYSSDLSPAELYERTEGFIVSGITGVFPEYLAGTPENSERMIEEKAIIYAAEAHRGTCRKGSGLPYIVHPMEVMMLCSEMTDDSEVVAAAALHDVVEDTDRTLDDVEKAFGARIATLVGFESENKREDQPKEATWKIRKQENLERERTAPVEARMIMLADKVSNMRATAADFSKRGEAIWEKFNMKDPVEQEWYYRSVADVLSDLSEMPQYQEYLKLLEQVFSKNH